MRSKKIEGGGMSVRLSLAEYRLARDNNLTGRSGEKIARRLHGSGRDMNFKKFTDGDIFRVDLRLIKKERRKFLTGRF